MELNINMPNLSAPKIEKVVEKKSKDCKIATEIKELVRNSGRTLYSYSRLSTFNQCQRAYYYGYVQKDENGKRVKGKNNVYALLGGLVHECLEDFMEDKVNNAEMLDIFNARYQDLKIPKGDSKVLMCFPSDSIENRYVECIRLFLKNYKKPECNVFIAEQFLFSFFNEKKIFVQGYSDCILGFVDENGQRTAIIDDYKTSTKWSKGDVLDKGRQLAMYAHMYTGITKIPIDKVRWNMIKYAEVTFPVAKTKLYALKLPELKEMAEKVGCACDGTKAILIERLLQYDLSDLIQISNNVVYERNVIPTKIAKAVSDLLKNVYLEGKINHNLELMYSTNDYESMELDVKDYLSSVGFKVEDWYLEYVLSQDIFDEMENYVVSTVNKIESLPEIVSDHSLDKHYPTCEIKDNVFYCTWLCSYKEDVYGKPICKKYQDYLNNM
ncbi:MAG: PD-(D/E)XK nuclease family protein [Fusobacteriaceae bacterium]